MRFVSIWLGAQLCDSVEAPPSAYGEQGPTYSNTWWCCGTYALDPEGRPWCLCEHTVTRRWKWLLVEDLTSGAAGRQALAEAGA